MRENDSCSGTPSISTKLVLEYKEGINEMMSVEKKVEARALHHTKESLSFILKVPRTFKYSTSWSHLLSRNMTLPFVWRFLGTKLETEKPLRWLLESSRSKR